MTIQANASIDTLSTPPPKRRGIGGSRELRAFLVFDVRPSRTVSVRLCWYDKGLHRRRLGVLKAEPTMILDAVLAAANRLDVDELIRLRNADKSLPGWIWEQV